MRRLRIGTRGSPLARWQAETVAAAIARAGGPAAELVLIRTSGDRLANKPISGVGGKRLFVKEIEEALVDGRVDLAVHSAKDLPAERLPGLKVQAVLPREDARDAVVARRSPAHAAGDPDVLFAPERAPRVGTGSVRRTAQLRHASPHLDIAPIRGTVGTRLDKLEAGGFVLTIIVAAVIHNVVGYLFGYGGARALGLRETDCRTVAIEVGLQNGGMASGLAVKVWQSSMAALPSAVFGPWMNMSGAMLASWWSSRPPRDEAVTSDKSQPTAQKI